MKETVIVPMPGSYEVNYFAEGKLRKRFIVEEVHGTEITEPEKFNGWLKEHVKVIDDHGSRRSVIEVND